MLDSSLLYGHIVLFHLVCIDFDIIFINLVSEYVLFLSVMSCHVMTFLHDENHVHIILFPSPLPGRVEMGVISLVRAATVQAASNYLIRVSVA